MATAGKAYVFEVDGDYQLTEVEQFVQALGEIKKDDTLKVEEVKKFIVTTTRQDVAAVLEPIFKPGEAKRTWKKKAKPVDNNPLSGIPEPGGFAPYQGN